MFELNFRNVRLIVYTLFTWLSLVATASAQNAVHKSESSPGAKRTRILNQTQELFPGQDVRVTVNVDDLHGIAAAVMFCSGMLGIVYVILQNALILEGKKHRWIRAVVREVDSSRGHLILLCCAVFLWVGTIGTTIVAIFIAFNREQKVSILVNGIKLNQAAIDAIEKLAVIPQRYWGHGYVRFMCIAPWPQVALTVFPFVLHVIAYRRLRAAARTNVDEFENTREPAVSSTEKLSDDKTSVGDEVIELHTQPVRV